MTAYELATALWRLLATASADAQRWAGIGYRLGLMERRVHILDDLEHAGRAAARDTFTKRDRPSHAELQRRRGEHTCTCGHRHHDPRHPRSRPHAHNGSEQPDRPVPNRTR